MGVKKIPVRMCCGCGEKKSKKELIRIVKTTDNEIKLDFTGKLNGRGAYICSDTECLEKARKSRRIERTFEMQIGSEIYEELINELQNKIL